MSIYGKPIAFALMAVVVVSIGTVISTFLPMALQGLMTPEEDWVKPYTALELEGRDIYIREGCNNCHTQTVRPLLSETSRYGEYSRLAEGVYDRPFLWGSKRTGPDLARIGGKYPDSWHVKHMNNPREMFPESNMPPYPWLGKTPLDTSLTVKKMQTLGFPYTDEEIAGLDGKTELDAMIAYLQKLGKDIKTHMAASASPGPETEVTETLENPFAGDREAARAGEELYSKNCESCHGAGAEGGICPNLVDAEWKYGSEPATIFTSIAKGRPGGMPPWETNLGAENIWRVVTYLQHAAK